MMKTIKKMCNRLTIFTCLVVLMVGCLETTSHPEFPSSSTPSLLPLPINTLPLSTEITSRPAVSSSSTPSLLPLPTDILSISTETTFAEQTNQYLIGLLQNANCTLPCLLGITPGVSTALDVHKTLLPFTHYGSLPMDSIGGFSIEYPSGNFPIAFNFYYFPSNAELGMIDHIYLNTEVDNSNGPNDDPILWESTTYGRLLQRYRLPSILSNFGQPSYVFVSGIPGGEPTASNFFDLRIAYPEKGFYIGYYSLMQMQGKGYERACPSESFVSIWAEAPNENVSLQAVLRKMNNWPNINTLNNFKPLEDVTHMTLSQFYKVYSQPIGDCFVMPTTLWP